MSTPQAITQAQIQSYRDLVEEQGINAVAAILSRSTVVRWNAKQV